MYGLIEEIYGSNNSNRIAYGIVAYANYSIDGTASIVMRFCDISSDKSKVMRLVESCNCLGLSLIHLQDVVEDFLAQ